MLTYDDIPKPPGLEELFDGVGIPDVIECGENNEVWFHVCRSKRELRITNKVDGKIKKVEIGAYSFSQGLTVVTVYGMGPRQWGAAWAALQSKVGVSKLGAAGAT